MKDYTKEQRWFTKENLCSEFLMGTEPTTYNTNNANACSS